MSRTQALQVTSAANEGWMGARLRRGPKAETAWHDRDASSDGDREGTSLHRIGLLALSCEGQDATPVPYEEAAAWAHT